jgi:hypothetical protein
VVGVATLSTSACGAQEARKTVTVSVTVATQGVEVPVPIFVGIQERAAVRKAAAAHLRVRIKRHVRRQAPTGGGL